MWHADKRRSGEGAMKGWATRRRRIADRRAALDRLIEVADSITSDLVVGERAAAPGKYIVGALTLINWRDRITSALRILDVSPAAGRSSVVGEPLDAPSAGEPNSESPITAALSDRARQEPTEG